MYLTVLIMVRPNSDVVPTGAALGAEKYEGWNLSFGRDASPVDLQSVLDHSVVLLRDQCSRCRLFAFSRRF
jgi:hypothetical protein